MPFAVGLGMHWHAALQGHAMQRSRHRGCLRVLLLPERGSCSKHRPCTLHGSAMLMQSGLYAASRLLVGCPVPHVADHNASPKPAVSSNPSAGCRCTWPTKRADALQCGTMTRAALRRLRSSCLPRWACLRMRVCVKSLQASQQPWTASGLARRAQTQAGSGPDAHTGVQCIHMSSAGAQHTDCS